MGTGSPDQYLQVYGRLYVSLDMVRPEIDAPGEVQDAVEQFAAEKGLRKSRAWGELVRSGLRHEHDWEDPFVRSHDDRTQLEMFLSLPPEDREDLNESRLETWEEVIQTDLNLAPVRCVKCGKEHLREESTRRDGRGDLLCTACWHDSPGLKGPEAEGHE